MRCLPRLDLPGQKSADWCPMDEASNASSVFAELGKTLVQVTLFLSAWASRPPQLGCATGSYTLLLFVALPLSIPGLFIVLLDVGVVWSSSAWNWVRFRPLVRALVGVVGLCVAVLRLLQLWGM